MNTASPSAVRRMLRRLVAVGLFAPWRGGNADTSEGEVIDLWVGACRSRGVTEDELDDAVATFADKATRETRWPAPGDVLPAQGAAKVARVGPTSGCRHCTEEGYREVAHHHLDAQERTVVDIFAAYCDCPRGEHFRQQRALPLDSKGPARQAGVRLSDFVDGLRNRPSTIAVYVDPTPGQRRVGVVPVADSTVIAGLRAQLEDARRNGARYEADQRARKAAEGRNHQERWDEDEDGARW